MTRPPDSMRQSANELSQTARPPNKRLEPAGERKRKCSDRPSQNLNSVKLACDPAQENPSAKKIKFPPNFPPAFWDKLSKIWLTPRALRELDRRNQAKPLATRRPPTGAPPTSLAQFVRSGGPDLSHLRGYPEPEYVAQMNSSRGTQFNNPTGVLTKPRRSSAYDEHFERDLINHGIYPATYAYPGDRSKPVPKNLEDIIQGLKNPRASLSPSRFSPSAFTRFEEANDQTISESKVMSAVLPTICGNTDILNERNLRFTHISEMTDGTRVNVAPDFCDGAYPDEIDQVVQQELGNVIIPSTHVNAPVAPNFFLECKSSSGGLHVVKRQACLDGAYGARAMHALQSCGETEPTYDGNAYAYSATYHAGGGILQLYAHHTTKPLTTDGRPEYHMTRLKGYLLTSSQEDFIAGATAFRNARELAQRHRKGFIRAANARASKTGFLNEEPIEDPTHDDSRPAVVTNKHTP